ncbi:MAG: VOC family protein [Gammaproteobacteria bacterium]|nr:VOC family protein [Gammaproteobacteria bacterium]MBU1625718.1 VOC family protein [Gammaproteobacteria bacterium]MBU1980978.1 VOC family protein [Gammaproteobacteria bacterium]
MPTEHLSDLILGIDHVALAVCDIDSALPIYAALGFKLLDRSEVHGEHSGMLYATLKSRDATLVLVQGTSPASQVSQFIDKFGAGMHHVAFAVSNLDEALRRSYEAGISTDTPVVSDTGIRQTFLHRDERTGVRIELIERHDAPFSEQNVEQLFRSLEAKGLY